MGSSPWAAFSVSVLGSFAWVEVGLDLLARFFLFLQAFSKAAAGPLARAILVKEVVLVVVSLEAAAGGTLLSGGMGGCELWFMVAGHSSEIVWASPF